MIKWLFDFDPKMMLTSNQWDKHHFAIYSNVEFTNWSSPESQSFFLSVLVGKWWELTEMMVDILQG